MDGRRNGRRGNEPEAVQIYGYRHNIAEEYLESFEKAWPEAIRKVKELSENWAKL